MRLSIAKEVSQALMTGGPVVALETSVVAQGLPHPHNLEAARACEEAIRRAGAIPAATAVIDGEVKVGLSSDELRRLAEKNEPLLKLGSRDLCVAVAQRRSGGTTVSATCEIAAAAGIRVFATGGLGGVHRGASEHFDISQDLGALARFPIAVVCAGAKSVLDLPKTMELLETLGVPVVGVGTDELPAFYSVGSGIPLEHRVEDAAGAAALARARMETLGQGGMVFTLPPPPTSALPSAQVELHLSRALQKAAEEGVKGKAVTPFLLKELVESTGGKTLRTNIDLLVNNAGFAGALAVAWSRASVAER